MADTTTFIIKRHDTLPSLTATLKNFLGLAIDLTNTSVFFTMRDATTGAVKIDTQPCVIVSGIAGIVSYPWTTTDTDDSGEFMGEFEIEYTSGKMTVPTIDSLTVVILEDFNDN
jgi:hypothetical protein